MRHINKFGKTSDNIYINIYVNIKLDDYILLKKWDFNIEKNTQEMLKTYAAAIRKSINE